jgi:hypothetical protein
MPRKAAFGTSCPFRLVLANVPSLNPQQPFAAAGDNLLGQAVSVLANLIGASPATATTDLLLLLAFGITRGWWRHLATR